VVDANWSFQEVYSHVRRIVKNLTATFDVSNR
jgi:hypothetical protein